MGNKIFTEQHARIARTPISVYVSLSLTDGDSSHNHNHLEAHARHDEAKGKEAGKRPASLRPHVHSRLARLPVPALRGVRRIAPESHPNRPAEAFALSRAPPLQQAAARASHADCGFRLHGRPASFAPGPEPAPCSRRNPLPCPSPVHAPSGAANPSKRRWFSSSCAAVVGGRPHRDL